MFNCTVLVTLNLLTGAAKYGCQAFHQITSTNTVFVKVGDTTVEGTAIVTHDVIKRGTPEAKFIASGQIEFDDDLMPRDIENLQNVNNIPYANLHTQVCLIEPWDKGSTLAFVFGATVSMDTRPIIYFNFLSKPENLKMYKIYLYDWELMKNFSGELDWPKREIVELKDDVLKKALLQFLSGHKAMILKVAGTGAIETVTKAITGSKTDSVWSSPMAEKVCTALETLYKYFAVKHVDSTNEVRDAVYLTWDWHYTFFPEHYAYHVNFPFEAKMITLLANHRRTRDSKAGSFYLMNHSFISDSRKVKKAIRDAIEKHSLKILEVEGKVSKQIILKGMLFDKHHFAITYNEM